MPDKYFKQNKRKSVTRKSDVTGFYLATEQDLQGISIPEEIKINSPDASVGAQCSTFRTVCAIRCGCHR